MFILGEGEVGKSDQADLQIADLGEEEIEEFAQNDEKPNFLTQSSRSSEHADVPQTGSASQIGQPQQVLGILNPPLDSTARLQGPVVGSTPSQLSPMGTPIHQAGGDTHDVPALSPTIPPMNPPGFDDATVPGSPFYQPSQETKGRSVFAPFGNSGPLVDAFTSILSMSDADRRHDAWIPSDATSLVLKTVATSPPGTFVPATEQLSTPGVLSNEAQVIII